MGIRIDGNSHAAVQPLYPSAPIENPPPHPDQRGNAVRVLQRMTPMAIANVLLNPKDPRREHAHELPQDTLQEVATALPKAAEERDIGVLKILGPTLDPVVQRILNGMAQTEVLVRQIIQQRLEKEGHIFPPGEREWIA